MLVSEGQTALKRYGFDDSDLLLTWMNAGMRYVEDAHDWSFLQSSVAVSVSAGATTIPFAADVIKVQSIRDTLNRYKLKYLSASEFERSVDDPTQRGVPEIYTIYGTQGVQLYPIPDLPRDFHIVYQLQFTDMSTLGVAMPGPSRIHYPIIEAAAMIALQTENEEVRAISAQKVADASIERLWNKFNKQEDDEPQQVTDVMSYGSC